MGEKGNVVEAPLSAVGAGAESVLERVTTTTTQTVVQAGSDLATAVRDKGIDAVADATVAGAKDKLAQRDDAPEAPPASS